MKNNIEKKCVRMSWETSPAKTIQNLENKSY